MKGKRIVLSVVVLGLLLVVASSRAQEPQPPDAVAPADVQVALAAVDSPLGTAFTYQGRLTDGGNPANGAYDLQFKLYDALSAGAQVSGTLTLGDVAVSNGLFSVALDFGSVFTGTARYLEIGVRPGSSSGAYTTLSPRQQLRPAPYALRVAELIASNPNNRAANVLLTWHDNWPCIYYGGDGPGASNGFLIQGAGHATKLAILNDGTVGIGTTDTRAKLDIVAASGRRAIYLSGGATISSTSLINKWNLPSSTPGGNATLSAITSNWNTDDGIGFIEGANVSSPIVWMYKNNRNAFTVAAKRFVSTGEDMSDIDGLLTPLFQVRENGNVGIGTVDPKAKLDVKNGVIRVSDAQGDAVVEIGAGLDYAETFAMSGEQAILPGMVVAIDSQCPGSLRLSAQAYDRKVAGVVAGANGLGSGVRLGDEVAGGQPVALAGRVYCYMDASSGAIQPGDLLTTSATPGYAMKVGDYAQSQGAILGKAMGYLKSGEKGLILILVTLQ
jgi:hypothetical protein